MNTNQEKDQEVEIVEERCQTCAGSGEGITIDLVCRVCEGDGVLPPQKGDGWCG